MYDYSYVCTGTFPDCISVFWSFHFLLFWTSSLWYCVFYPSEYLWCFLNVSVSYRFSLCSAILVALCLCCLFAIPFVRFHHPVRNAILSALYMYMYSMSVQTFHGYFIINTGYSNNIPWFLECMTSWINFIIKYGTCYLIRGIACTEALGSSTHPNISQCLQNQFRESGRWQGVKTKVITIFRNRTLFWRSKTQKCIHEKK